MRFGDSNGWNSSQFADFFLLTRMFPFRNNGREIARILAFAGTGMLFSKTRHRATGWTGSHFPRTPIGFAIFQKRRGQFSTSHSCSAQSLTSTVAADLIGPENTKRILLITRVHAGSFLSSRLNRQRRGTRWRGFVDGRNWGERRRNGNCWKSWRDPCWLSTGWHRLNLSRPCGWSSTWCDARKPERVKNKTWDMENEDQQFGNYLWDLQGRTTWWRFGRLQRRLRSRDSARSTVRSLGRFQRRLRTRSGAGCSVQITKQQVVRARLEFAPRVGWYYSCSHSENYYTYNEGCAVGVREGVPLGNAAVDRKKNDEMRVRTTWL